MFIEDTSSHLLTKQILTEHQQTPEPAVRSLRNKGFENVRKARDFGARRVSGAKA